MTLEEAFIMTCHTAYVCDESFLEEDQLSQEFLDKAAQLLMRDVYLEEFLLDKGAKVLLELKSASYDKWMEIVKSEKT